MVDDNQSQDAAPAESCELCHGTDRDVRPWVSKVVTENLGCHFGVETYNRTDPCWGNFHNKDAVPGPPIPSERAVGQVDPLIQFYLQLYGAASMNSDLRALIDEEARKAGIDDPAKTAVRAADTLRRLARGENVTREQIDEAVGILEAVANATLIHVQRIRGPILY